MGRAVRARAASGGRDVVATARREDLLGQLAAEYDERIEVVPGDITDVAHRQALLDRLTSRGRLDVLVNNAGICDDGLLEHQSLEELRRVIEVNLISVLDVCRLTAPLLFAAPAASVINVAPCTASWLPVGRWPLITPPRAA
ncbi:MAG TPA: SDR family oxidoreductase [Streptosporangiaceae bacterium]|nr:SDR family oxidoreductase [Streptosporangiaceae bacterium]